MRVYLCIAIAGASFPAFAFIDPPMIDPTHPTTASNIDARIRTGLCDGFLTLGSLDRELEIVGQRVIIRAKGFRTTDSAQCNFPPSTFRYNIGALPAGTYQLEIYMRLFLQPGQPTELVGTLTFGVAPAPQPVPLPLDGRWSLLGLLLGVGVLGSVRVLRGA